MRRTPRSGSAPFGDGDGGPEQVLEFASQAVEYVRRAVGVTLEYNSETLPILDHYLRQVVTASPSKPANGLSGNGRSAGGRSSGDRSGGEPAIVPLTTALVAATSGAYFGEVVRRRLGGSWHLPSADPGSWRLVLPSGVWFWPAAMAMATILGPEGDAEPARDPDDDDDDDGPDLDDVAASGGPGSAWDASLQAPPPLRSHVARVLEGMADVSEEEYYSLCCRLDTLEHVQAVLVAMASARPGTGDSDAPD
jgi:hypothetical protein